MTHSPFVTYLKTYRKRTGFTHEEVAFLMGAMSGQSVSRHESYRREPAIRAILFYEIIFGAPVRELYEGVFREAEQVVAARAAHLKASLNRKTPNALRRQKLKALARILGEEVERAT